MRLLHIFHGQMSSAPEGDRIRKVHHAASDKDSKSFEVWADWSPGVFRQRWCLEKPPAVDLAESILQNVDPAGEIVIQVIGII